MSSTRLAAVGAPLSQERYASSEVYRTALSGHLVAKRCAVLDADPELRDLIWFIQDRSLADPFHVGGRLGSVERIAEELANDSRFIDPTPVDYEDFTDGRMPKLNRSALANDDAFRRTQISLLSRALCDLALSPGAAPSTMPRLGANWRKALVTYRDEIRGVIVKSLAPTSVAKVVAESLRFTRDTKMLSLVTGVSRLGKSASAKAFCAASSGLARYVLTPEDNDMQSLYRSIAKALGVADSASRKPPEVRELLERTLLTSRQMLVFDEAHNLFSGARRVTRQPQRILWLRRLIDGGVPIAFVALPDFTLRIGRYADQLDWDSAQIFELIAKAETLPSELSVDDHEVLVKRLAPELNASEKSLIASAAKGQRGAQYVCDVLTVARHNAKAAGRCVPTAGDVTAAIGNRPAFKDGKFVAPGIPSAPEVEIPRTKVKGPLTQSRRADLSPDAQLSALNLQVSRP